MSCERHGGRLVANTYLIGQCGKHKRLYCCISLIKCFVVLIATRRFKVSPHCISWEVCPQAGQGSWTFPIGSSRLIRTKMDLKVGIELHADYRITSLERTIIDTFAFSSKLGETLPYRAASHWYMVLSREDYPRLKAV